MRNVQSENFLAKLLGFTGAFTTIFIISASVTDPVNAPKLMLIGVLSCALLAVLVLTPIRSLMFQHKVNLLFLSFFIIFSISSCIFSKAPVSQLLYGSYGRNNGLLAYIFLSFIYLSALSLNEKNGFQSLINGLVAAGVINLIYCLWVLIFGDFISWNNPYGNILGTLGNPNFIGAFLGIIFSTLLALLIDQGSSKIARLFSLVALPICAFEIIKSHAIQGRVVALFGSAIIFFIYIRSKYSKVVVVCFSIISVSAGAFALAGALQIGPLTKYIYKTSVSLRGQYWLAGWNTGKDHPFTGVGMDTFGDWYRRMRDPHALDLPGVNTVVNAAHNVFMDMFAFGGWPLFIAYLCIMAISGFSCLKLIYRSKKFDSILAILCTSWLGYQLQSIISINQIGLAVWGWILSGAVISYERYFFQQKEEARSKGKPVQVAREKVKKSLPANVPLYATFGGLVGLLVALPPLTADTKWRNSQVTNTLNALENSMKNSYFNPPNSMKYLTTIQTLERSQLFAQSHTYALESVRWNPDSFELWKALYLIKNSTREERLEALKNMRRLDPLNPDVTLTQ